MKISHYSFLHSWGKVVENYINTKLIVLSYHFGYGIISNTLKIDLAGRNPQFWPFFQSKSPFKNNLSYFDAIFLKSILYNITCLQTKLPQYHPFHPLSWFLRNSLQLSVKSKIKINFLKLGEMLKLQKCKITKNKLGE